MGLSASQGRLLLLTARQSDLEFRAQQISQKRLLLSQQLEEIAMDYEDATSNRQMTIRLYPDGTNTGSGEYRTENLTYKTLISGTMTLDPTISGINPTILTQDQDYSSTSKYRLVDVSGAIVVSSYEEICKVQAVEKKTAPEQVKNGDTVCQNLYKTGDKKVDASGNTTSFKDPSFYLVAQANSALATFLEANGTSKDNQKTANIQIDIEHGLVSAVDKDGNTKYFKFDGSEETNANTIEGFESSQSGTLVANMDHIPKVNTTEIKALGENQITQRSDGKYDIEDADGNVIATYVVDPTLAIGGSDTAGDYDGPNYLQDCLRNGKYLLQKTVTENDEIKWSSVSWDATTNIQDQYYTEDDDKAKAKYDRLQTQIQAQDKKLEIELDNIETQRKAVTTEKESVEKVIQDNIEGSFKTFA